MGGDRLRFRDKTLILNGSPVQEPYAIHSSPYIDTFRDNFPARLTRRCTEIGPNTSSST